MCGGVGVFVSCVCLGLVLHCMEAHSCQKRTCRVNLTYVLDKENPPPKKNSLKGKKIK